MSLVNHSITNLINGVSQQATSVRLDNQFEEQVNCFSDVTAGLTIRNGLELKNVVNQDLTDRHKIEFDVDGEKYLIGLNADLGTPVIHVPLTADVVALSASLTASDYFKNISAGDIKVIEDKDRVYILNKNKEVGTTTLASSFYDVRVTNERTNNTDENWSTGEYRLTVTSVADPSTTFTVSETPINIDVDDTMSPTDVAAAINATSMTNETGECYAVGNKGAYRIVFDFIPQGYVAPEITILETVNIEGTGTSINKTANFYDRLSPNETYVQDFSSLGQTYFYWNGTLIGNTLSGSVKTFKVGSFIYYRETLKEDGTNGDKFYSISRGEEVTVTDSYVVSITEPNTMTGTEFTSDKFADKGMIWVSGVSTNQSYDVTIEYEDATGTPQTPLVLTTISVGTSVSNIKLNWVAGEIQSQIDGSTDFTAVQYDNAVYFHSTTEFAFNITNINVSNSFDMSSINAVIRATVNNENAVQDTSNLPASFVDGFKVRIGDQTVLDTNYYLKYDSAFKGWKECGLDESRVLDGNTMPYKIEKSKIRQDKVITIEPVEWSASKSGDDASNPYPSFSGKTVNDMFFYGSRLGMATDDTIIMSKINAPETFFRTTCSEVLESDRVDIKLDTSKIGYDPINNVVTYDGRLFVNTGDTQSVLLVNTAFELTKARLSQVSSYSLGDFKPLPVNSGLYFALANNEYTNIFNYSTIGQSIYEAVNITKHIPTYIEGTVKHMSYANDFAVVAVEEDAKTLYVQNRYTEKGSMLQNAWHKWTLPYPVEHFYFDANNLFVLMSAENESMVTKTIVTKYELTPQAVTESNESASIGWRPYLDCWTKDKTLIEEFSEFIGINDRYGTKFDSVTEAYDSTENTQVNTGAKDGPYYDLSSPIYSWVVDGDTVTVTWNDGTPIVVGNSETTFIDSGGFRYTRGEEQVTGSYEVSRAAITTLVYNLDEILYGVSYETSVTFSEFIPRQQTQDGFVVMNYARLMLRRMRLYLSKSGTFSVDVNFEDRKDYTNKYTGQPLGKKIIGRSNASDINFQFPINGRSNSVTIKISSNSSTPFNLLSAEWQGQITQRGRNI